MEEDTPQKGEKKKPRRSHKNNRIVADQRSRPVGGKANPTPTFEAHVFKRASDRQHFNPILETCVPDTGCTSSCLPLTVAKAHRIEGMPLDADEPSMHSCDGSKLNVIGQAKLYIKIKTPTGLSSKKCCMH